MEAQATVTVIEISEVSRSLGTWCTALVSFLCKQPERERQPGIAEGKEILCFVLTPSFTPSGNCPATLLRHLEKKFLFQGLSELS